MGKKTTIKCPNCGCEYLPAELFYPKTFFGEPTDIVKDETGAILGYSGADMNTSETYLCDKCNKSFSIEATVAFKTSIIEDVFEDDAFSDLQ